MEAILENIPTGVVSLTPAGEITRMNSAVVDDSGRLRAERAYAPGSAGRRSGARGAAFDAAVAADGRGFARNRNCRGRRLVRTAVTVSSLGPRRSNPGFVVVIDDLTDLLRAQKAAAGRKWRSESRTKSRIR